MLSYIYYKLYQYIKIPLAGWNTTYLILSTSNKNTVDLVIYWKQWESIYKYTFSAES